MTLALDRCADPLAERRFLYAREAAREGAWSEAAELLEQAIERAADWAPAWFALGEARERLSGDAASAYRAALRLDPGDRQGAGARLARLEGRPVAALPAAYVARLFDDYADRFEDHLVGALGYRGPEIVLAAIEAVAPGRRFRLALDLGCGSGLMGRALRGRAERLVGVDLSPAMLARAGDVYDETAVGDLVAFLAGRPHASADLAVAADTLVYLGDLRPMFAAVAQALAADGLFAFTVEMGAAPFELGEGLRFRHSDAHLRAAAKAAGLSMLRLADASTRKEGGAAVAGRVVVLAKE